jgi:hypothetical protein
MRKALASSVAAASLVVLAVPSIASAAHVIERHHENFTDSFDDEFCGFAGTSVVRGVDNFTLYSNNMLSDNVSVNQTFTADNGNSIVFHFAQRLTSVDEPIDNGDGTVTFVYTFKGLPEQIRVSNGPVLTRDAGTVTFTVTFAVDPDTGEFTFVSQVLSGVHGPHPDLLGDFELFCDVIIPALS